MRIRFEFSMGEEDRNLLRDSGGKKHLAMADRQHRAARHALDRSLLQADHAVIYPGQGPEQPPESQRQAAGDDAEGFRPPPLRGAPFAPQPLALAEEPAPGRM